MNYVQQKITIPEAEEILFDLYNIRGTASPLPGYVDFNFRIKIEGEEGYILKISRVEENKKYLEYQQHLLQFIENSDEEIFRFCRATYHPDFHPPIIFNANREIKVEGIISIKNNLLLYLCDRA